MLYRPLWLRGWPYLRRWAFNGSGMWLLYRPFWLLYRPLWLRGWPYLRRWAFNGSGMWLLHRPLWLRGRSHLLRRRWLLYRPFLLSPLDGGLGLLALLHRWRRSRLTPFYGKRLGDHDRLRLAAVYSNELGAVCTRRNPVLLLNG